MRLVRSQRGVATVLTGLAVSLAAVGNASADTRRISDGNDRPGRLDIRSATHGHAGARVVHKISTVRRWPVGLLRRGNPNLFAVEISTDADPALERVVLVFSVNGRMVAGVFRLPGLRFIGSASASRPNAQTVRVAVRRSRLGNPRGYRWNAYSQHRAAGACSSFCIDRAPNNRRILHDITPPAIRLISFPLVPADTSYDVSFAISDDGGAGLRSWTLQRRLLGSSGWSTEESGRLLGRKIVTVASVEEADEQFRVVAVDKHGNRRVSPIRLVSVPLDDATFFASGTVVGSWTGGSSDGSDFRSSLHWTTDLGPPPASITIDLTFGFLAIVGPTGANAPDTEGQVYINNNLVGTFDPDAMTTGRRRVLFTHKLAPGTYTVRIEAGPSGLILDGVITR